MDPIEEVKTAVAVFEKGAQAFESFKTDLAPKLAKAR